MVLVLSIAYLYQDFLFGQTLYIYTKAGFGGDDYRVYFPVIQFFNDWMRNPAIYSLNIAGGESIFAWANILFDPFNWVLFLTDSAWYPELILCMQIIKHAGIFLVGYLWLKEVGYDPVAALAGAICVASIPTILSPHYQFVSYYLFTLLYLWGVERCLKSQRGGLVVVAVLFLAITSMYGLYKVAIFTSLYLGARVFALNLSLSDTLRVAARLFLLACLTLLVAAPLILPAVELYLGTTRSAANFYSPSYLSDWVYHRGLVLGLLGVGPSALLVLPGLWLLNGRGKLVALGCLVALVLFTSNVWFISLTTGFAKQTEFYFNFFYAVPLVLGVSYTVSRRDDLVAGGWVWAGIVLAVGLYFYSEKGDPSFNALILGSLMVSLVIALFRRSEQNMSVFLLLLVFGFQGYWMVHNLAQQRENGPMLAASALEENSIFGRLNDSVNQSPGRGVAGGLDRAKKTFTVTGLNDSLLFGYRGTEIQASAPNANYIDFAVHYFQVPTTLIQVINSTPNPLLDDFLGINTVYSQGALAPALGYQEVSSQPGLKVYSVPQTSGLGVFTEWYLTADIFATLNPRQRLWQLHNAVFTESEIPGMQKLAAADIPNLVTPLQVTEVQFSVAGQSRGRTVYQINMPQMTRNKALSLNLRFKSQERRFLQVVGVDVEGTQVDGFAQIPSVARDAVKSPVWLPKDRPDLAMAMQLYDYEQLIAVVTGKDTGSLTNVYLAMQEINPSLDYSQHFEKQGKVELTFINEGEIRGTVESSKAGMLVLQIPLRAGWQLDANGEVRELQRVNHGLMGVFLPDAGVHDISLRYRPTYWRSSFVLCLLGVFFAALYLRFSRHLGREAEPPTPHGYKEVEADRRKGES